jgi:zinc transport system substrate-binding protein
MTSRPVLPTALLATCALVLSACGGGAADSGKVSVVTSFYPVQFVAERVAGDRADVTNLTAPGGEPHDLELSPRQVADVQDADLVVYQKGFQTAVDEAVDQAGRAKGTTVDAADGVSLIEESQEEHADEEGHDHAEDEGHEHAEDEGHEHADEEGHGHDHGGVDPHLWLDPTNLEPVTEHVRDALVELDPDHAAEYRANADALVADLESLDDELRTGLADCQVRDIVTSHAAFAYLARAYDLVQVPIAGIDPGTEPSAAQLATITDLVKRDGITTVFTETLVSPAVARTVAREAGVRTATLDPIEGLTKATSDEDYLSIMRNNLATLQKANRCS